MVGRAMLEFPLIDQLPADAGTAGNVKKKRAPPPGLALHHSLPPCARTMERLIDRPRPVPPGLVVKNGLNSSAIVAGIDAGAAVRDHELDVALAVDERAQHDLAARFRHFEHRVDAVADQVENDLLDLHRVGLHQRRLRRRLQQHAHAVVARVGLRERQHVFEQTVRLDQLAPHLAILDEGAQAADHFAGAQRLRADVIERGLDLVLARSRLCAIRRWHACAYVAIAVSG